MVSDRPSQEGKLSPGAPNDPVPFGPYYLMGLIARGGMAEVYRARTREDRAQLSRLLAIKVMRPRPDPAAAPVPGDQPADPGAARRVHRGADRRGAALRARPDRRDRPRAQH